MKEVIRWTYINILKRGYTYKHVKTIDNFVYLEVYPTYTIYGEPQHYVRVLKPKD